MSIKSYVPLGMLQFSCLDRSIEESFPKAYTLYPSFEGMPDRKYSSMAHEDLFKNLRGDSSSASAPAYLECVTIEAGNQEDVDSFIEKLGKFKAQKYLLGLSKPEKDDSALRIITFPTSLLDRLDSIYVSTKMNSFEKLSDTQPRNVNLL